MRAGDVLSAAAQAGLTLKAGMTEDSLKAYPAAKLTAELATVIKEHKADIIQVLREDELMRRYIRAVRGSPIYRGAYIGAPIPHVRYTGAA